MGTWKGGDQLEARRKMGKEAVDRDAKTRMQELEEACMRTEMLGGVGLKRPRPKLDCSAIEEKGGGGGGGGGEEEEEQQQ
jgi:hypothetical protein